MKAFFKRYNFVNLLLILALAVFWLFLFFIFSKFAPLVLNILSKVALVCSCLCWIVLALGVFYIILSEIELKKNPDFED